MNPSRYFRIQNQEYWCYLYSKVRLTEYCPSESTSLLSDQRTRENQLSLRCFSHPIPGDGLSFLLSDHCLRLQLFHLLSKGCSHSPLYCSHLSSVKGLPLASLPIFSCHILMYINISLIRILGLFIFIIGLCFFRQLHLGYLSWENRKVTSLVKISTLLNGLLPLFWHKFDNPVTGSDLRREEQLFLRFSSNATFPVSFNYYV